MVNYYDILGVKWNASQEEIKVAYRKSLRKYHPDTSSLNEDEATQKLQLVMEAYKVLRNPMDRHIYDVKLGIFWTKNYYNENWSDTVDEATRKVKYSIEKIWGRKIEWNDIDWKTVLAVILSPLLIYYCFEFWTVLVMFVLLCYFESNMWKGFGNDNMSIFCF